MLKTDSPYKSTISQSDAKQHLHNIRHQRQNQLKSIIDECHQLRILHKRIFDNQVDSYSAKKPLITMPKKNEAIFIINPKVASDEEFLIAKELTIYLSEPSCSYTDPHLSNHEFLSSVATFDKKRSLSVSSAVSIDKQTSKIWLAQREISQIYDYPIEKLPHLSQRSVTEIHKRQKTKMNRFVDAINQIKSRSTNQRNSLKRKPHKGLSHIETVLPRDKNPDISSLKLPPLIYPTSLYYSKRILTRQWLCQNDFSTRTLPLI